MLCARRMPQSTVRDRPDTGRPLHTRTLSHTYPHMPTNATNAGEPEPDSALFFPRMDPSTSSQSLITGRHRNNLSTLSLSSRLSFSANRISTLEAYDLIYGIVPSSADAVERLYEAHAGMSFIASFVGAVRS